MLKKIQEFKERTGFTNLTILLVGFKKFNMNLCEIELYT